MSLFLVKLQDFSINNSNESVTKYAIIFMIWESVFSN